MGCGLPRAPYVAFRKGSRMGTRRSSLRLACATAVLAMAVAGLAACTSSGVRTPPGRPKTTALHGEVVPGGPDGRYVVPAGIHKIKHVIIIMQENRSFDSYFGTSPGADGIRAHSGVPAVCVPSPSGGCTRPYRDLADVNGGGPHAEGNAVADVNGGQMNGFIKERDRARTSCHVV